MDDNGAIQALIASPSSRLTKEQLESNESTSYLRSLSTFSLSDLRLQPELLRAKAEDLDRQLSDLCITQTDAFVHLHAAELSFSPALRSLSSNLDHLVTSSLPSLQAAAAAFHDASRPSLDERGRIGNVMEQLEHGVLSDILDLPGLVDTCVRARHYAEAVQLGEHIAALTVASYASASTLRDGEVLLSLLHDTWAHLAKVKVQLIAAFARSGLKLPAARRTASTLRKLDQLSRALEPLRGRPTMQRLPDLRLDESQLCLCYLKARSRFLIDQLASIVGAAIDTGSYLRRYIDAWREGMADTLAMAVAIFADSAPSQGNAPTPSYLVSAYSATALDRLTDTLQVHLPKLAGQSADDAASILSGLRTQLDYTSKALARYGFDFAHALRVKLRGTARELLDDSRSSSDNQGLADKLRKRREERERKAAAKQNGEPPIAVPEKVSAAVEATASETTASNIEAQANTSEGPSDVTVTDETLAIGEPVSSNQDEEGEVNKDMTHAETETEAEPAPATVETETTTHADEVPADNVTAPVQDAKVETNAEAPVAESAAPQDTSAGDAPKSQAVPADERELPEEPPAEEPPQSATPVEPTSVDTEPGAQGSRPEDEDDAEDEGDVAEQGGEEVPASPTPATGGNSKKKGKK